MYLTVIDYGSKHWEQFASVNRWVWLVYRGERSEQDVKSIYQHSDVMLRTNSSAEWWELAPVLQEDSRVSVDEIWCYEVEKSEWRQLDSD